MTTSAPALCSQAARDSADDPAGTAAEFSSFLLLDHAGSWSATAAEEAARSLPADAASTLAATDGLRVFAIRNVHPRQVREAVTGYRGINGPDGFVAPLRDRTASAAPDHRSALEGPLFAVCTNGRRDRCCAIVGRGVAVGLHAEFGDRVVEISHLGGHRYAGTMLVLPWGYAYGFLDLAGASAVAEAAVAGLVHPDGLRGRADLGPIAQAADVLVRRTLGPAAPDAVVIRKMISANDRATVLADVLGRSTAVELVRQKGPVVTDTVCGGKPFATGRWVLESAEGLTD